MTDSPPERSEGEPPHDVLAAEEFVIPQPEPSVPHDPDPTPHDVLAAEEFAFPAPGGAAGQSQRPGSLPWLVGLGAALIALLALVRGRRRRPRRR
jgi:hypothetical protein